MTELRVAYLINQYPAVSHSFIRREIAALERAGVAVQRYALRGWDAPVVDAQDERERGATRYVLQRGAWPLVVAMLARLVRAPRSFVRALRTAWQLARGSDRSLATHLAYLGEACVLERWCEHDGATHLHAHFATNPAQIALLVRMLGGPPYSFTGHGSDIVDRPAQIGLHLTVTHAAFVVAVCAYGRSQIMRWVPADAWPRVHVVRCGLEPGYGASTPPAAPTAQRLLCIGRLSREKGQLLLVEAAAQLALAGRSFELVLAGDGPMRSEVDALIDARGLRHNVTVTGWLDADGVQRQLDGARALVVASLSEGLPVVIMEAMAKRLPVIAPWLAGIPELVRDGETGWMFPAGDAAGLAAAMAACLDAPEARCRSMGDAGRQRVWASHNVDVEARRLLLLFASSSQRPATP